MKFLDNIINNESKLQRVLGLKSHLLTLLIQRIKPDWEEVELKRLSRPNRIRTIGGGPSEKLKTLKKKFVLFCSTINNIQHRKCYIKAMEEYCSQQLKTKETLYQNDINSKSIYYSSQSNDNYFKHVQEIQELKVNHNYQVCKVAIAMIYCCFTLGAGLMGSAWGIWYVTAGRK